MYSAFGAHFLHLVSTTCLQSHELFFFNIRYNQYVAHDVSDLVVSLTTRGPLLERKVRRGNQTSEGPYARQWWSKVNKFRIDLYIKKSMIGNDLRNIVPVTWP